MINIDELYTQVENPDITRNEILTIIDKVEYAKKPITTKYNVKHLFFKIATLSLITDDLILWIFEILKEQQFNKSDIAPILDYASKIEYDRLWKQGNYNRQWSALIYSKWCDGEQLTEYYNSQVVGPVAAAHGLLWIKNNLPPLLKHPNCPEEIQNDNLDEIDKIIMLAHIPKPSKLVLESIKRYLTNAVVVKPSLESDQLFWVFVKHSALPWLEIIKISALEELLTTNDLLKSIENLQITEKKLKSIHKLCKRKDASDRLKLQFYELTNDDEFLPSSAKEIFLF